VELPFLVAVTELERWSAEHMLSVFRRLAERASPGKLGVQLRGPGQPARRLLELGRALSAVAGETGQHLIVNDRLDLALELGAPFVHLAEKSVSAEDARRLCPGRGLFRACHDPSAAAGLGVDAVVLSPIAAERKGRPPLGAEGIRACVRALRSAGEATAVYALGGIEAASVEALVLAGASGFLAMDSVFGAKGPDDWAALLR